MVASVGRLEGLPAGRLVGELVGGEVELGIGILLGMFVGGFPCR